MKILFTSDWQLGAGADLGQGDHGPGSRFQDQVDVLNRIVDLATAEQVGLIAMLGDTFERARPAPHEILAVQAFVRRATSAGIRVLFLRGNHDARGVALPSALEIFVENGCAVSLLPSLHPIDDVVIATLPWTPAVALAAAMPDVARDDVNDTAAQALVAGAKALLMRCRTEFPELKPILVGHWAVSGAVLPTGLPTAMLREPVIPLEGLSESGFALAMLGHIHVAGMIASGPTPVGYCGTPYVCNWAEAEQPHGVWLYDSEASSLRFAEVEDNVRFVTLDADLTSEETSGLAYIDLGYAASDTNVDGAVVRARYTVTEAQSRRVDQPAIREALLGMGALKVVFRPTIVREQRARVAEMADDLTETAALDLWLTAQQITGDQAAALHAAHADYLTKIA